MLRDRSVPQFRARLTLLPLLAALLTGCASSGADEDEGPVRTEQRELPHFSRIEVTGPVKLEVAVNAPLGVSVSGDRATLERLETEVVGQVLKIRLVDRSAYAPAVQVGLPHLSSLVARSGATTAVSGLQGGQVELALEGLGQLRASGSVLKLVARVDGAGTMDLERLSVRDAADVNVRGAGRAVVTVAGALNATVNGDGDILYRGSPIVFSDTSGSGKVAPRR
jgi:hypothetical protein